MYDFLQISRLPSKTVKVKHNFIHLYVFICSFYEGVVVALCGMVAMSITLNM